MPKNTDEGRDLTVREVAEYRKVMKWPICRRAAAKRIPVLKVGGIQRFRVMDINGRIVGRLKKVGGSN